MEWLECKSLTNTTTDPLMTFRVLKLLRNGKFNHSKSMTC